MSNFKRFSLGVALATSPLCASLSDSRKQAQKFIETELAKTDFPVQAKRLSTIRREIRAANLSVKAGGAGDILTQSELARLQEEGQALHESMARTFQRILAETSQRYPQRDDDFEDFKASIDFNVDLARMLRESKERLESMRKEREREEREERERAERERAAKQAKEQKRLEELEKLKHKEDGLRRRVEQEKRAEEERLRREANSAAWLQQALEAQRLREPAADRRSSRLWLILLGASCIAVFLGARWFTQKSEAKKSKEATAPKS